MDIAVVKVAIFVAASAALVYVSWGPLRVRDRSAHGFFRLLAWEAMLTLFLLNVERWFADPLSLAQIISWALLIASAMLAVHGFWLLREIGRPRGRIEETTQLVAVGAYRYIRHPLYAALLCLTWGIFLKAPSLPGGVLALAASAFLFATAKAEEAENVAKFGDEYRAFMTRTKMFIPFVV